MFEPFSEETLGELALEHKLLLWVQSDPLRVSWLEGVRDIVAEHLDCTAYIAAGAVRNLVWDKLHQLPASTPLNDVDVIFYAPNHSEQQIDSTIEKQLTQRFPDVKWEVKNQARMHLKHGEAPYQSCVDAMSYWPEQETAVAVGINAQGEWECLSPFGLSSLFAGVITYNPKRSWEIFSHRVTTKDWLIQWPHLRVVGQPLTTDGIDMDAQLVTAVQSYQDSFNRLSAQQIAEHYSYPCLIVDGDGQHCYVDPAFLKVKFDNNCKAFRKQHFQHCHSAIKEYSMLNERCAQVTLAWKVEFFRNVIQFNASYTFLKQDNKWLIVSVIVSG